MREASPVLEKRTSKNIVCIKFGKKNEKDGYNIETSCIGVVHEMTDFNVYDAIKRSQSNKKEPLILSLPLKV